MSHPHLKTYLEHPSTIPRNILWRIPKAKSSANHIFIIGAPRSGTTLIKSIIAAHSQIGGVQYESTGIMTHCEMRSVLMSPIHEIPKERRLELYKNSRDIVDFYDTYIEIFLEKIGKRRFVDKVILHAHRLWFLLRYFPKAKFINIYRDGRDAYCSAIHHKHVPQGRKLEKYAHHWNKHVNIRCRYKEHPQIFDIKYEDLTSDPGNQIKMVMDFLGETFEPIQIDPEGYSQTTNLIHVKHHQNLNSPINTLSQGRWNKELTPEEKKRFFQIAGKNLLLLGYLESP